MARVRIRGAFVQLVALLCLTALPDGAVSAAAPTNPLVVLTPPTTGPVLTGATCTGGTPAILLVTGEEFTPGGEVEVLFYRPGNATPVVVRSLRASLSIHGPNGSTDPARGFQRGGFLGIALGSRCIESAAVRAFDRQAATWTNPLPIDHGCEPLS
jgi:hypothetical protein